MKPLSLLTFTALGAFGAFGAGCAPAVVQTPCVPNPVMMGPVTRIAAKSPSVDKTVKEFEFEAIEGALKITSADGTTRRNVKGSDHPFSAAAVTMTDGRPDRDLRITSAPAGSYVFVGSFGFYWWIDVARWIKFEGNVAEVRHGH